MIHVLRVVLPTGRVGHDAVAAQDRFDAVRLHEKGDLLVQTVWRGRLVVVHRLS